MRSSLIYLALVGLPLVALIGIMKVGERIVPPKFVGGVWHIEADFASTCRPPSSMEITQSGIVLDLYVGDIHGDARIRGDRIASSAISLADGCAGEWQIDARVTDAENMAGHLRPLECDTCSAIAITAKRSADAELEEL